MRSTSGAALSVVAKATLIFLELKAVSDAKEIIHVEFGLLGVEAPRCW
jgi:hypothetical protein